MQAKLRPAGRAHPREPLLTRTLRFGRSLVVGAGATAADMTTLTVLVAVFHVPPLVANVPSLLVGLTVQFIGARQWVFRAGEGNLKRHLSFFLLTETGTLIINAILFWLAVAYTPIPYWAARPLGTFVVYVGFSYPLWKRIFRVEAAREGARVDETLALDPEPPAPERRVGGRDRRVDRDGARGGRPAQRLHGLR